MYGHRPPPTFNDRGEPVPPVSPQSSSICFIGTCSPNEKTSKEVHYSYDTKGIDDTGDKYANMIIKDGKYLRLLYDHSTGLPSGHILMTYRNKNDDMCIVGELTNATEGGRAGIEGVATHQVQGLSSGLRHRVNKTYVAEIPFQETIGHSLEEVSVTPNPCYKKTTWIKYYSDNIGDILNTLAELATTGSGDNTVDVKRLPAQLATLPQIINRQGANGNIFSVSGKNHSQAHESTFASSYPARKNGFGGGGRISGLNMCRSFFSHVEHHGKTGATQGLDQFFTRDTRARANPNFPGSYISSYTIRTKHSAGEPIWLGSSDDDNEQSSEISEVIAQLDRLLNTRKQETQEQDTFASATQIAATLAKMSGNGGFSLNPGSVVPGAGFPAGAPTPAATGGAGAADPQGATYAQQVQLILGMMSSGHLQPSIAQSMIAALGPAPTASGSTAVAGGLPQQQPQQQQQQPAAAQQPGNPLASGMGSLMTPAKAPVTPSSLDLPAGSGIGRMWTEDELKDQMARDQEEQAKVAEQKKKQEDAQIQYDVLTRMIRETPSLAGEPAIVTQIAKLTPLLPKQPTHQQQQQQQQSQSQQAPLGSGGAQLNPSQSSPVSQAPAQQSSFAPPVPNLAMQTPGAGVNTVASGGAPAGAGQPAPGNPAAPIQPSAASMTPSSSGVPVDTTPNRAAVLAKAQQTPATPSDMATFFAEMGEKNPEAMKFMAALYQNSVSKGITSIEKFAEHEGKVSARLAVANAFDDLQKKVAADKAKAENDKKVLAQNEIYLATGENLLSTVDKYIREKATGETLKFLADFRSAKTNPEIVLGPEHLSRVNEIVKTAASAIASQSNKERETDQRNRVSLELAAANKLAQDKINQERIQELARYGLGPDLNLLSSSSSPAQQPQANQGSAPGQSQQPSSSVPTNASAGVQSSTPATDSAVDTKANDTSRSNRQGPGHAFGMELFDVWNRSDDAMAVYQPMSISQMSQGFHSDFNKSSGNSWTSTRASAGSSNTDPDEAAMQEKMQRQMRGGSSSGSDSGAVYASTIANGSDPGDVSGGRSFTTDDYERTIASSGAPPIPGVGGAPGSEQISGDDLVRGSLARFCALGENPDLMFDRLSANQLLSHVTIPGGKRPTIRLVNPRDDSPLNLYSAPDERVLYSGLANV